jgi:hypothetical protein
MRADEEDMTPFDQTPAADLLCAARSVVALGVALTAVLRVAGVA